MNTAVHDLASSTGAMNLNPDIEKKPRMTLQQRQVIAKDRFRKAKQERKRIHEEFVAKLYPHPVLRPECLRTKSNPNPPALWYGFPLKTETYRDYIVKKGNPDGMDLNLETYHTILPAVKLLREVFGTQLICEVPPLCPYSDEFDRMIGFKCSLSPSAHHPLTEADERMAAMLREELGLPEDRPCLWHFAYATADKAIAMYESYSYVPVEYAEVTWDDLLDSEISDLELSDSEDSEDSDESDW